MIKSNISSRDIGVFVQVRVYEPGLKKIPKGSSLNQAVILGDPKLLKGKIEFVRLNRDSTLDRRIISYKPNAAIGSYRNPILMDGDMIRIRGNLLTASTEVLTEVTSPIVSIYALDQLLNLGLTSD